MAASGFSPGKRLKRPDVTMTEFERLMLPHLDTAYRLAAWLTHDEAAAQDIVQDSYLRAFKAWQRFTDGNARAWLLTIVRRRAFTWLSRRKYSVNIDLDDDEHALSADDQAAMSHDATQEAGLIARQNIEHVRAAIAALPAPYREVIVLKDIEGMPYAEMAQVMEVPIGTVMSRLSRGRERLRDVLIRNGYAHGS